MKTKLFSLAILFVALSAAAQTVSPLVTEAGSKKSKASGSFIVRNDSLKPLRVTIQPFSFLPNAEDPKKVTFARMRPEVHLELSETSTQLGPQQEKLIFWKATCDQTPCYWSMVSSFSGQHTDSGIAIVMNISSTVYLCEKQNKCRDNVWTNVLRTPAP